MSQTVVDKLYEEFKSLVNYLDQASQPSLRVTADDNLRKALLLAAASYFESRISSDILLFANEASNRNQLLVDFIKNKAVSRHYHEYFDWDAKNANKFFALFGEVFTGFMRDRLKEDPKLSEAIRDFLELGRARNLLVHEDFGNFYMEKTADEIYQLFQSALVFVDAVPDKLRSCVSQNRFASEQRAGNVTKADS